ncbi:DEAD/DEAH box helicase [Pseudoteredinibacter isoporae]|uniref:Superfamily II DNA or RNA helicase n=1 Tax=Pseudoteredinibacter isoporae TaxID=570281 RepID=A0A7X0JVR2_9GAMM|nr:DEAD/DEAH box helicase family protein [Pseudoteredinibacter isoporae]MBB6522281.1 superfamily II DNA or RNA helicase [Pseudoteredinibacter isoporae]NHO87814.1 DEAD/DEAH box helicase family protein [Pseudoteredinibacter isoporae]NIB23855.1 DEAD/DEAH box helicase family protein [Pseudoteredinibacter isoporae]
MKKEFISRDYFSKNYKGLVWPIALGDEEPGFRNAQLGALHAIGSHFTNRTEPGIVTMPTGSGKTAVLIAAAFLLRANRVLVITPSRLVREQIAEQFETLDVLKKIQALPETIESPKVFSTRERLGSDDDWEKMKDYDVVVGTLPSISPSFENIPNPPTDLFDLVLVDEAHHSPARTWKGIIDAFDDARKILLTATPFRRDNKEIKGRLIYSYPLSKAYHDGIFGEISYIPVELEDAGSTSDIAIAKEADRQYKADSSAGFDHRIMIRTDSKKRASELAKLYQDHTDLKLKVVKGDHSLKHVNGVIKSLSDGSLDGIICVDMLGEGFDFPSLKIAAVHSPHKSLAVTLQFVGRFARTAGAHLGPAKFIAVPSEIKIESERLYRSGTVWQEMIANLSSARVERETAVREALESFEKSGGYDCEEFDDMSLYTIEPYHHVKVYSTAGRVDLRGEIAWPQDIEVIHERISDSLNTAIFITKEVKRSSFSKDDRFNNVEHDAFIIYYDEDAKLVFLCFTRRTPGFYDLVLQGVALEGGNILPLNRINRALNGLKNHEFFNVGMRNRSKSSTSESYRIISGAGADKAIQPSDSRLYHRGHCFGSAEDNGEEVTIGISSTSKIWSNKSSQIPELIAWCKSLAKKVTSDLNENTRCGLDLLSVGQELEKVPENVMYSDWDREIYKGSYVVEFLVACDWQSCPLLDCDIEIDYDSITDREITFNIVVFEDRFPFKFSILGGELFAPLSETKLFARKMGSRVPLECLLNDYPLVFYTGELSSFHGLSFMPSHENSTNFRLENIIPVDWEGNGVDVRNECKPDSDHGISIQSYLSMHLAEDDDLDVVYFDHGTGEIADFITVNRQDEGVLIEFYHCKKAGGLKPGDRVEDAYEVCGQSIKCTIYTRPSKLFERINYRFNERKGACTFIKGDLDTLRKLVCEVPPATITFRIIAVQPGISADSITGKLGNILASVDDYLIRERHDHFRILGS